MKDNWELSFGTFPGILFGMRTYREELKKNHPEAYKLLQKYTENIQTDNDDGGIRIKVESNSKNN